MKATVLRQHGDRLIDGSDNSTYVQDAESGAIKRVWGEDATSTGGDLETLEIVCSARGIVSTGIRGSGSTQHWGPSYEDVQIIHLEYPATFTITDRDKITNIRDSAGNVVWVNTETDGTPTVFDVAGITPSLDPFNRVIKYTTTLRRSEVQQYGS